MERITKQRKAILACLQQAAHPLTIDAILLEVAKTVPSINLSTLYRNLKVLIFSGQVEIHEVVNSPTRYTLTQTEHAHHFLCQQCHRLFTVPLCPKDIASMVPEGFVMYGHSITLTGLCQECNKK